MSTRLGAAPAAQSHLSPAQLRQLRRLLVEEHATQHARAGELQDPPDMEPDLAEVLSARCREALEEIEVALMLLEKGHYGACSACGTAIPYERLEVMPAAQCCVSCQSGRDRVSR
jgi:DnaK suppressor protein